MHPSGRTWPANVVRAGADCADVSNSDADRARCDWFERLDGRTSTERGMRLDSVKFQEQLDSRASKRDPLVEGRKVNNSPDQTAIRSERNGIDR